MIAEGGTPFAILTHAVQMVTLQQPADARLTAQRQRYLMGRRVGLATTALADRAMRWKELLARSLVKGSSGSHSLDQMAKLVHLACFAIRSVPYFEYIESKANWADEISRVGAHGNWAPRNALSVEECGVVVELLTLPSLAVIRIFEYL